MQSNQFDTFLRLHDPNGNKLAENDDIAAGKNLNSRITFTPKKTAAYLLIATSFQQRGRGAYVIVIREFAKARE